MSSSIPPRRHRARPGLVALEDRTLLAAGSGAFAYFSGTLTGAHPHATIPMTISRADFNLASGAVMLGLDMQTPDRLRIVPDGRGSVRTLALQDGSGYSLVELGAGTYTLHVSATGRAGGLLSHRGFSDRRHQRRLPGQFGRTSPRSVHRRASGGASRVTWPRPT